MIYLLTDDDWTRAEELARHRSRGKSVRDDADFLGAIGEVAFGRSFGLEPKDDRGEDGGWDFTLPDGATIDVKTISGPPGRLSLLVPKHARAGVYVLSHADYGRREVRFLGWMTGGHAVQVGTIAPWGKHYMVPTSELWPFDTLKARIDGA